MNTRNFVIVGTLLAGLLANNAGFAQEGQRAELARPVPCPHPSKLVITGHNPATFIPSEFPPNVAAAIVGSVFNQPNYNKAFGYTFTFPVCPQECCQWTTGSLEVKFKALQGGSAGSSTSWNDNVVIYANHAALLDQRIWSGTVVTGQTKTDTFAIPGTSLASGHVSLYVEDDTAVESAVLTLEGCCVCVK